MPNFFTEHMTGRQKNALVFNIYMVVGNGSNPANSGGPGQVRLIEGRQMNPPRKKNMHDLRSRGAGQARAFLWAKNGGIGPMGLLTSAPNIPYGVANPVS